MGACYSVDENTQYIESRLSEEKHLDEATKKILFLGPGGSGKSTIFKQLQWLHLGGFTERDALNLKRHIFNQTVHQMKFAVKYYESQGNRVYDTELEEAISIVKGFKYALDSHLDDRLADAVKYIWTNDGKIKNVFHDFELFQHQFIDETTEHFWNSIDRIKQADYVPNEDDILNVRCRTTGVVDKSFSLKGTRFHIFDVGGQKSERRKWIHFFNEVHAVLFVISLACYDQFLFQDMSQNCMQDSLELFESVVNNKHFDDTHFILFLNKKDIFETKLRTVPITACSVFDDFNEFDHENCVSNPHDFVQATNYIKSKFQVIADKKEKQIYTHLTYAFDRNNIDRVFVNVHRIIITANFAAHSLALS